WSDGADPRPALLPRGHEPGRLQHRHVLLGARERDARLRGELPDRRVAPPEPLEEADARGVGQGGERLVDRRLILNHLVQYGLPRPVRQADREPPRRGGAEPRLPRTRAPRPCDTRPAMPHDQHAPDEVFRTARLRARRWRESDLEPLLRVYGDADAMRWVGDGSPLTPSEAARWLEVTADNYARRGYGMFAL